MVTAWHGKASTPLKQLAVAGWQKMVCYSHIPASLGLGKLTGVAIVLALMKPRKKAAVNWRHAGLG